MPKRFTLFAVSLLLVPEMVSAAGLGRMTTKSGLGEPLRAEVEILESFPDEIESTLVRLANKEEYAVVGLADAQPATSIRCTVVRRENGQHLLLMRSEQPVTDPFLELLIKIESRKAATDFIRQYTVLLEPPGVGKTSVPPVSEHADATAAATTTSNMGGAAFQIETLEAAPLQPASVIRPRKQKRAHVATASVSAPVQASGETYTTQSGDVFGKVAQRFQPVGVPLKKVMAVMFALNPHAFKQGDMRHLKTGVVMQAPALSALGIMIEPVASPEALSTAVTPVSAAPKPLAPPSTAMAAASDIEQTVAAPVAVNTEVQNADIVAPNVTVPESPIVEDTSVPSAEVQPASSELDLPAPPVVAMPSSTGVGRTWPIVLAFAGLSLLFAVVMVRYFRKNRREQWLAVPTGMEMDDEVLAESQVEANVLPIEEVESTQASTTDIHLNEVDPLVEAEVLLSYGHVAKAEEVLNDALQAEPEKSDIALALLRIYANRLDKEAFERLAKQMKTRIDAGEESLAVWQKVNALSFLLYPERGLKTEPESTLVVADAVHASQDHSLEFTLETPAIPAPAVPESEVSLPEIRLHVPDASSESARFPEEHVLETIVLETPAKASGRKRDQAA